MQRRSFLNAFMGLFTYFIPGLSKMTQPSDSVLTDSAVQGDSTIRNLQSRVAALEDAMQSHTGDSQGASGQFYQHPVASFDSAEFGGGSVVINRDGINGYNASKVSTFLLSNDGSGRLGMSGGGLSWNTAGTVSVADAAITSLAANKITA